VTDKSAYSVPDFGSFGAVGFKSSKKVAPYYAVYEPLALNETDSRRILAKSTQQVENIISNYHYKVYCFYGFMI
jgi:hypothetical protein